MNLPPSAYTQMLVDANQPMLDDLDLWIFHPGMLYESNDKWWGDFGTREFPHEGIDLCLFQDRSGQMCRVGPETRIPAMHDGIIRAMFKDYLGQAIIVEHNNINGETSNFITVYAHTKPQGNIQPGLEVIKGAIIATIADTTHSKAKLLPHLHLSVAIPAPNLSYEKFVWNIMRDPAKIALRDPLTLLKADYHIPDKDSLNQLIVDSHPIRS